MTMIDYVMQHLWSLWAVVAMACLILEMSSGDFYITCFGVGAIAALLLSLPGVPFWVQVVAFAVFSVISIYFLRPRILACMNNGDEHRVSNADAIIGRVGEVSETIKTGGYGRVKLDGDDWKAESDSDDDIAVGTKVRIVSRESIIVRVEKV